MTALVLSKGSRLTLAYNGQGRLISVTDPAGRATTFTYDANNEYLLSATDAFGTTRYTYETAGTIQQRHALTSIANPDGTHVFFTYDTAGRLIHRNLDGGADKLLLRRDDGSRTYRYPPAGRFEPGDVDAAFAPNTFRPVVRQRSRGWRAGTGASS